MTGATFSEILSRLERGAPTLSPELLEFYRTLLRIQANTEQGISLSQPDIPRSVIAGRTQNGLTLLTFADLALDWRRVQDTFAAVVAVFARHPQLFGEVPLVVLDDSRLLKETARAWYDGHSLPPQAAAHGLQESTLETILLITLKPFLVSHARRLLGQIDQERWRRGVCPICGGIPDLACLEKENGARYLVCSRCDTEWLFQRLQCPYCGNTDQNSLAYFTDDLSLYRVYICEQCHHYLKTIDLRQEKSEVLLPLERILTVSLDAQAQQQGYTPPGSDGPVSQNQPFGGTILH